VNSAATARPSDTADRHRQVVVLVEDDDGLRAALDRVLCAWGFETRSYESAEAALSDPALDWPDCLVVDLGLPAMSGLDLIDRLRERGVMVPAVVISAQDESRVRQEAQRRGIVHILAKPFLGSTLVREVDAVLGERHHGSG
jgi:FixJ family two-component response regulator